MGTYTLPCPPEEFYSRLSGLFGQNTDPEGSFDVAIIAAFDSANLCDLVDFNQFWPLQGRCTDNIKRSYDHTLDRLKMDFTSTMNSLGLKVSIEIILKTVNFLEVALNLEPDAQRPFRKSNAKLSYINRAPWHPAVVFRNLAKGVSRRFSLSSSKEIFDAASSYYNRALAVSSFKDNIR